MSRRNPAELFIAEPPAAYRVLPPLVVDASVINALLFDHPEREAAKQHFENLA